MPFRLVVMAIVVVVVATGCVRSKVDPGAQVVLRGALSLADGSPAAGVRVALVRVPDIGEVLFQGMVVAGTVGVACLSSEPPPVCKLVQSVTTDANGEYIFRMRGSDVRGTLGQATNFHLSAVAPGQSGQTGSSIDVGFRIQRENLTIPALRFWEPRNLSARPGPDHVTVDWLPADDRNDVSKSYRVHFTTGAPGTADVWQQEAAPGDRIDARATADLRGNVHVTAYGAVKGPDTKFTITYASQRIAFLGVAGAPVSRGSACWVQGVAEPVRLDTCTLTDGSYAQSYPQQRCDNSGRNGAGSASPPSACRANTSMYVDLGGGPRPILAVFAHSLGASGETLVETSDDTERWTVRGRLDSEFSVAILQGVAGRYVRLRAANSGTPIDRLHELSIWTA
jgi:hypothetical protein